LEHKTWNLKLLVIIPAKKIYKMLGRINN
jgi:hypothetical protein